MKNITEAREQFADEAGKILEIVFDKPRESTGKIAIKERAPPGLVPFQARILAAYPTKSLNNRIYTKELLQGVPPLYVGKPFILDHNIEDVDVITGIVTGAKYGLDETSTGGQKEGLWLDTLGYMDEKLFAKMKGSRIIPPFIKGVSIGGEGEGDFRADGGIMIKKFLPAEISMTGFPGLPDAHVSQLNKIRESYKHHEDGENTKYPVKETEVSLEEAEKIAKADKTRNRTREGPLPPGDTPQNSTRADILRGTPMQWGQNDRRPGLPTPTSRTNQVWIQPQPTTSSPGTVAFPVNPQNPTGSGAGAMTAIGSLSGVPTATQTGPVSVSGVTSSMNPYLAASSVTTATASGSPGPSNLGPNSPQGSYGTSQTVPAPMAGGAPGAVQNMSVAQEVIPGTVPGPSATGPDAQPFTPAGIVTAASTTSMPAGPISTGLAGQAVGLGTLAGQRGGSNSAMTYVGQMTPEQVRDSGQNQATTTVVPTVAAGSLTDADQAVGAGQLTGNKTTPAYQDAPYNNRIQTPMMGATTTTAPGAGPQAPTGNPYPPGSSSAVGSQTGRTIAQSSKKSKKTTEDTAEDGEEEEEEDEEEEGGEEGGEAGIDPIRKAAGQGQIGQRAVVNPVTANQSRIPDNPDIIPIQASAPAILWGKTMDKVLAHIVSKQSTKETVAVGNDNAVPTKSITALPALPYSTYEVDPRADYERAKQLLKEETEKPTGNIGTPASRAFVRLAAEKGLAR
ncbi:MAG TPA: hypothetical protein VFE98_02965 [Candidatus Bathyarchaeia archaeon]|nr:hypothetical protein [Candidatus Bathyarchaeia archaeon]